MAKQKDMPPIWIFPSHKPGKVIVCSWNPDDNAYNKDCREMDRSDLPLHLGAAVTRVQNAVQKYPIN